MVFSVLRSSYCSLYVLPPRCSCIRSSKSGSFPNLYVFILLFFAAFLLFLSLLGAVRQKINNNFEALKQVSFARSFSVFLRYFFVFSLTIRCGGAVLIYPKG